MHATDDPQAFTGKVRRRAVKEMPASNIVVLGKTGVGKSTLLNGVFGADLAETGVGRPVTKHIHRHQVDGIPVAIFDTRGIELQDDPEAIRAEFDGEINGRLRKPEPERLHVLWYCVSAEGSRFEDAVEAPLIRHLGNRVPTVVVLTRSYSPVDDDVRALGEHIEGLQLPIEGTLPVLALERRLGSMTLPAHGLEALVARTAEIIPEGVRRAFVNGQIVEIDAKVELAFARVDELSNQVDTAYAPAAFLRGRLVGGHVGADVLLAQVLTAVGEAAAVFGDTTIPDDMLKSLAVAVVGDKGGNAAITRLIALINVVLIAIPPVGPTAAGRYGAKLIAGLTSALAANHADHVARKRAAIFVRVVGRAMTRTLRDVAIERVAGRSLEPEDLQRRFDLYVDDESKGAATS